MMRLDEDFDTVNAVAVCTLGVLHFRALEGPAAPPNFVEAHVPKRKAMAELSRELLQLQQASEGRTLNAISRRVERSYQCSCLNSRLTPHV